MATSRHYGSAVPALVTGPSDGGFNRQALIDNVSAFLGGRVSRMNVER